MLGRAEEGVHRPMAIRRDQDHRTRRGLANIGRGRDELDPGRSQVVTIEFPELIRRDLADKARPSAKRRDAGRRIAGRASAHLMRRAHMRIEPFRLLGVDQPHRAFDQPLRRSGNRRSRRRSHRRWHCRCTAHQGAGRAFDSPGKAMGRAPPSGPLTMPQHCVGELRKASSFACAASSPSRCPRFGRLRRPARAARRHAIRAASGPAPGEDRSGLSGLTAQDLVGRFGTPALQIREGSSLIAVSWGSLRDGCLSLSVGVGRAESNPCRYAHPVWRHDRSIGLHLCA